jgi:hypothetical protein
VGEQHNVALGRKLLKMLDQCPDSIGPGDAASALGTTVDDWLAS